MKAPMTGEQTQPGTPGGPSSVLIDHNVSEEVYGEVFRVMLATLETYSNVHRGSGQFSQVTTKVYEEARRVAAGFLGVTLRSHSIVFCNALRAGTMIRQLEPGDYLSVSSRETGLPLGVTVLAINRRSVSRIRMFQTGGGTARLVSKDRVLWDGVPHRFEAGTPPIVNVLCFAAALRILRNHGIRKPALLAADQNTVAIPLHDDDFIRDSGKELLARIRTAFIGSETAVPTAGGEKPYINLDNGASTPTLFPVYQSVRDALLCSPEVLSGIPDEVRRICAGFLRFSLSDYDVLFTSNTTESINLVAESLADESFPGIRPVVVNTLLEHNSNDIPWRRIGTGSPLRLSTDAKGFIRLPELEALLEEYNAGARHGDERIVLVAVSGASNVLGSYNDLEAISTVVHRYGARLLVDGAQMVAHRPVIIETTGIDYFVFSGHKMYAPFGAGALVGKKGMLGFPADKLERIHRSGEENTAGIAALGKAMVLLQKIGLDVIRREEQVLTEKLLTGLARCPGVTVYGISDPAEPEFGRKGGVVSFNLKNRMAPGVARELAQRGGIGIRAGCHCTHILIKQLLEISPRIERLQFLVVTLVPSIQLAGMARISLGLENTPRDVDDFLEALTQISRKTRIEDSGWKRQVKRFISGRLDLIFHPEPSMAG